MAPQALLSHDQLRTASCQLSMCADWAVEGVVMRISALLIALLLMTASAAAETIDVKYWGSVDLRSYECANTASSFVHRICYDESKAHVVVRLRNTYYPYCRVDRATVSAWLNSSSKGRFYNANIKSNAVNGRFDCRR